MPETLLRTQALADYLGVSRPTLSKYRHANRESGFYRWLLAPDFEDDGGAPLWRMETAQLMKSRRLYAKTGNAGSLLVR